MYAIYSIISETVCSGTELRANFRMMCLYNILCFPHNHFRKRYMCASFRVIGFNYISSQGKREEGGVRLKRILV